MSGIRGGKSVSIWGDESFGSWKIGFGKGMELGVRLEKYWWKDV